MDETIKTVSLYWPFSNLPLEDYCHDISYIDNDGWFDLSFKICGVDGYLYRAYPYVIIGFRYDDDWEAILRKSGKWNDIDAVTFHLTWEKLDMRSYRTDFIDTP